MPVARLTALSVTRLPAIDGKRTDYRDAFLPGFLLRVTPFGARTYSIVYYKGRNKFRRTIGRVERFDLREARVLARDMLQKVTAGLPLHPRHGGLNVGELVGDALGELTLRPSTRKEWERLARTEIARIATKSAHDLSRAEVREWTRGIKLRSGWTANHAFELLRRCYSWAISRDILEASPCAGLEKPFEGEPSSRVLSALELWALGRVLDRSRSGYADVVRLLLLTGVRRESALGARRSEFHDLDGPDPRWIIPGGSKGRSKSGREHVVPLSPAAVAVVQCRLNALSGHCLFPIGGPRAGEDVPAGWSGRYRDWLKRRVARTVAAWQRKVGLPQQPTPNWKIHGLRHALATHLREDLGFDRDVVALVLGHSLGGSRVTAVYDRSEKMAQRRRALETWAAWLDGLGKTRETGKVIEGRFS